MINLLPPEQIEEIAKEKNLKVILHLGLFLFIFLISFYLSLFSIKIYLRGDLESKRILFQTEESNLELDLEKEIKEYNEILKRLDAFQKQKIYFSPIIAEIIKNTPEKISFLNLFLELRQKEGIFVSLSGFSQDRESLLEFIKILKEKYTEVNFPPEILLKKAEIDFSVNFKIK